MTPAFEPAHLQLSGYTCSKCTLPLHYCHPTSGHHLRPSPQAISIHPLLPSDRDVRTHTPVLISYQVVLTTLCSGPFYCFNLSCYLNPSCCLNLSCHVDWSVLWSTLHVHDACASIHCMCQYPLHVSVSTACVGIHRPSFHQFPGEHAGPSN